MAGMEAFLFRPDVYNELYDCSAYNVSAVPLEMRQHILVGQAFIFISIIYEILYIPCLIAIWKHRAHSCYKFMFYLGVIDITCVWISGFLTGYFSLEGAVFCSHPKLIYVAGSIGLSLWVAESTTAILLALNRCIVMWSSVLGRRLFKGKRSLVWLLLPTAYAFYFFWYTPTGCFSGIFVTWFFNPHVGYNDSVTPLYMNPIHAVHNAFVLCGLSVTYAVFVIMIAVKTSYFGGQEKRSSFQRMTFIQVALISAVNATAASVYVCMNYIYVSPALIIIGQFAWCSAHGLPCIIYLIMNKTIRTEVRQMFSFLSRKDRVTTFAISKTAESNTEDPDV